MDTTAPGFAFVTMAAAGIRMLTAQPVTATGRYPMLISQMLQTMNHRLSSGLMLEPTAAPTPKVFILMTL